MGQAKRKWEDYQEMKAEESLAAELGITADELQETGYWIEYEDDKYGFIGNRIIYFQEDAPSHILAKISGMTSGNFVELPEHEYYDDSERYEAQYLYLLEQKEFYAAFVSQINDVRKMNQVILPEDLTDAHCRLLFASCITVLETFLSDGFIKSIDSKVEYKKRFLKSHNAFKKKEELSKIYENYAEIDQLIRHTINQISFHNMETAKELYENVFDIDFDVSKLLSDAVDIRHHIVHRNGRNFRGEIVPIDREMVEKLIVEVNGFVEKIASELTSK